MEKNNRNKKGHNGNNSQKGGNNTGNTKNTKLVIENIMEDIEKKGYRDNKGEFLRKDLVSKEAEKIAEEIKNDKLSNSQLRAFFNEINKLKLRYIKDNEEKNKEKLGNLGIELLILKSKLEYKRGKTGNDKLPENFYIFMKKSIEYIVEKDEKVYFKDFKVFFETVIGYTYGLSGIK